MSCTKKAFLTRASAKRFKRNVHHRYGGQSTVYQCRECSTAPQHIVYHLTTKDREVQARIARATKNKD